MIQNTKKKAKQTIISGIGIVHIQSTYNNTIVTVTDIYGNSIAWASAGSAGFKGTRKGTAFAAQMASEKAILKAVVLGLKKVRILVKGPGSGREAAIRALQTTGVKIKSIKDMTAIPYNGCRPPKRRRI